MYVTIQAKNYRKYNGEKKIFIWSQTYAILKNLSQIDVFLSPKCSPIYYVFHFKAVLILSKINSFACESGVKKKFVVGWRAFKIPI